MTLDEAGYTAGYITGAFMLGRTIAATFWGLAADRFGRKICLFSSMVNVAILGLAFGFSTSFGMAVSIRLAIGLGNGFMGICKTAVTGKILIYIFSIISLTSTHLIIEMVNCKEHEMRAFGYINGVWGLGLIVGPAIGGLLSRPVIQYPDTFNQGTIWDHYPYLLPSIICSLIAAIAAVGVAVFVPETLQRAPSKYEAVAALDEETVHGKSNNESTKTDLITFGWSEKKWRLSQGDALEIKESDIEMQKQRPNFTILDEEDGHTITTSSSPSTLESSIELIIESKEEEETVNQVITIADKLPSTFSEILHSKNIQFLFFVYMAYCFVIMYVDETFPLWCVTSLANGGLGWEAAEVGETLACIGFGLVIFQLFIYEWMMRRFFQFGSVETYFRMLLWSAIFMMLLPIVSDLTLRALIAQNDGKDIGTRFNVPLRIVIVGTWLCYRLPATAAFTTLAIVVNASVHSSMRGTINGLIMTAGSLGNGSGPIVGSVFYAVFLSAAYKGESDEHKRDWLPIDGRAVFVTGGMLAIGLAFFVRAKMKVKE